MDRRRQVVLPAALTALLAIVLLACPHLPTPRSETAFKVALYGTHLVWFSLVVALGFVVAQHWQVRRTIIIGAVAVTFALAAVTIALDLDVASDVAKLWFACCAGVAFVRAVERPWWLLPIAVCVPLADAWSVYSSRGVTNAVIDRAKEEPRWLEWPTIATPIAGVPYELFGRLGIVDVLFTALFVAVAVRWRVALRRTLVALVLGLLSSTVLVQEVDDVAVPALPLLCVAFLLAAGPALVRDLRAAMRTG